MLMSAVEDSGGGWKPAWFYRGLIPATALQVVVGVLHKPARAEKLLSETATAMAKGAFAM